MPGRAWNPEETVLTVYFASRKLQHGTIVELLERSGFDRRSMVSVRNQISDVRDANLTLEGEDDLDIVAVDFVVHRSVSCDRRLDRLHSRRKADHLESEWLREVQSILFSRILIIHSVNPIQAKSWNSVGLEFGKAFGLHTAARHIPDEWNIEEVTWIFEWQMEVTEQESNQ